MYKKKISISLFIPLTFPPSLNYCDSRARQVAYINLLFSHALLYLYEISLRFHLLLHICIYYLNIYIYIHFFSSRHDLRLRALLVTAIIIYHARIILSYSIYVLNSFEYIFFWYVSVTAERSLKAVKKLIGQLIRQCLCWVTMSKYIYFIFYSFNFLNIFFSCLSNKKMRMSRAKDS